MASLMAGVRVLEQPCFSGRTAELGSSFALQSTPLLESWDSCLTTTTHGFRTPAPQLSLRRCRLETLTCCSREYPSISTWASRERRPAGTRHVRCQAKRKGSGSGKTHDATDIIDEEVLLGPSKGWTPGFKGLLFDPLGKLRLNPDLITPDLLNDNVDELGPADREAMQAPPVEPTKKKKEKKKAKEVKKPLTVADLELAGVPVNDQLRQILKEENRRAHRQAAEADGKKVKGPRPRGWQMPAPDNREVHKLLKIVGGQASGKRLLSPADRAVRPMMEVVRAAVFNMLQSMVGLPTLEGRWLDLYSGTGSVGLEALSRGCDSCHFVELDPWVVTNVLQPNIDNCDFNSESIIHTQKVEAFFERAEEPGAISGGAFDFISVTPPYEAVKYSDLMTTLATSPVVGRDTFIIVEYPYRDRAVITDQCGNLFKIRDRRYGRTNLAMYGPDWARTEKTP